MSNEVLLRLAQVIEERKSAHPDSSYVASLHHRGLDVMLKKLGEETAEAIVAAKNADAQALVSEMADLWFHALVVLSSQNLGPEDVLAELEQRFGLSGLAEKAARTVEGKRSA